MSVTKLLSRIVAPINFLKHLESQDRNFQYKRKAAILHDPTDGITSDQLKQFACVFSALIHDVDHSDVPNAQLILENSMIAELYQEKIVAEQSLVKRSKKERKNEIH